jgi:probable lipoprotein NlpC
MTHWSNEYVGLPYLEIGRTRDGCDCWGLAVIVYAEQLGITLPPYAVGNTTPEERAEIDTLIGTATATPVWHAVSAPQCFDLAVFRRGALGLHIGIIIGVGLMLHMANEDCAKVESYHSGPWKHRLKGIYRHVEQL